MSAYTTEEKQEAFKAADAYFERLAADTMNPESLRTVARTPNPLFPIFYADGYLAGRTAERDKHSSLRVAAKVMLKSYGQAAFDSNTVTRLMPGVLALRSALRTAYGETVTPQTTKVIEFICTNCGEDFTEPLQAFLDQPSDEIQAPALCKGCGCNAED